MLKLNNSGLLDFTAWENANFTLPKFDRKSVAAKTQEAPFWIHFGAGNIFRAFQANVVQRLLNDGILDRGLIVAEGYDYEIIQRMNRPHDDYSILVTLKADGRVEKTVVGSIVESLTLDSENVADYERLKEIFCNDSLQMASFTITEKGYCLVNGQGNKLPDVAYDMEHGTHHPKSYIGKVVSLLYTRYESGEKPIALVSMDNCSHNGDKLRDAVLAFADAWSASGAVNAGFTEYVRDASRVSFPWSMIDKITPRPDPSVQAMLEKDNVDNPQPMVTEKNTYVAPFVNAEESEYLVIEDVFPNGRPKLEYGGIIFTNRETVEKVERMKVCTCLNPIHTALAIFGCLLGFKLISAEMKDPALRRLAEIIGYDEGLAVVTDPQILNPKEFIDTVINIRIPNPFMPDTPQRIATDTSQKLAIRFGETVKAYMASPNLNPESLKMIPLVFAAWLRYLMGVDDFGKKMELSPDPLLSIMCPQISSIKLGDQIDTEIVLRDILENEQIFGVNLYRAQLAKKVCRYFDEMIKSRGAVRATLEKHVFC
ncbi:MAG: mannitol dehydrogenase family protein [Clostridia bacterium]|nr:mannitol dehydrogenase family protein [Clostridia bacterium]